MGRNLDSLQQRIDAARKQQEKRCSRLWLDNVAGPMHIEEDGTAWIGDRLD